MERRDFLKISAVTGATAALDSCGNPERQLIRFVPEEDLVPGVAVWKPGICALCPAGCGVMVRVMEGEAEVVRDGKLGLVKMGLAKKLEGNPNHLISQGKLCPRGQAGLQVTYHPDRVKSPLKRAGPRGSGQYHEVSWDDAIQELVSHLEALRSANERASLAFLTRPLRGQRRELVERFLKTFGAPPPVAFEWLDDAVLRRANALSFGRPQLPTLDLARANYVISFGADFLGAWNSPVAQAVAYGDMRQGQPGRRGKFVQVEPRISQTGANADEWIPARPGTEGALALGLAHVIVSQKLRLAQTAGRAGELIEDWSKGLPDYTPENVEKKTGVVATRIQRLGREMAANGPAIAIAGGAALAQTNGLPTALAVNALNALLGSIEKPGGIFFMPQPGAVFGEPLQESREPTGSYGTLLRLAHGAAGLGASSLAMPDSAAENSPRNPVKVLLVYEANPVYMTPGLLNPVLKEVPFIASFGSFIDETSALADLILPDHSFLESWVDDIPESGTMQAVVSLAPPAMRPLYNTRAMPDVLLEVARRLGEEIVGALPWKTFEEMLRERYTVLSKRPGSIEARDPEQFWKRMQEQGGWWSSESKPSAPLAVRLGHPSVKLTEAEFCGDGKDFPFFFMPYPSQMFLDGSLAHLPWMQETPDPLSTVMWGTWVEINLGTAERLNIRQGDMVEVASAHGKLQAPALLSPGIAPDVIAMPLGQGHENYGRYASRRGANPMQILAPLVVPETGSLAWAATHVKISRAGEGKLVLFAGGMRERPHEQERR